MGAEFNYIRKKQNKRYFHWISPLSDWEPVLDFSWPGYSHILTSTDFTAGGVIFYISNTLASKTILDLSSSICSSKFLEPVFVEIVKPNKTNSHPNYNIFSRLSMALKIFLVIYAIQYLIIYHHNFAYFLLNRTVTLVNLSNLNRTGLNLTRKILYLTTLINRLLTSVAWIQTSGSTLLTLK